jgi:beta-xylosidase
MNSYSDIDGVPVGASHELLTTVLRERWGFEGTVVSDYWAVTFLETMHRVAADPVSSGVLALGAGLDVELPNTSSYATLGTAVRSGHLELESLDRATRRVLRQKTELGLVDADRDVASEGEAVDLDSPRNRDIARRIAEESVTLLANDGILPLAAAGRVAAGRIAVVGPCAHDPRDASRLLLLPRPRLAPLSRARPGA